MTNLDSILKSRDITLPTKVHVVKALVFPVAMYGCESWTIRKAKRRRIDAFELWCWRRLLRVPWTLQPIHHKGNHSWIFTGRTDARAETPILWPPDAKNWLIWKDPDAGKNWRWEKGTTEDEMVAIQWTWVWVSSENWWWTGRPGLLQSMGSKIVGHNWATELNWSWRSWDKSWLLLLIRELFSRFWSQSLVFCNRFVFFGGGGGVCLFVCLANKTPKIWPSTALWKQDS